ncbi:MAG: hypothetical protein ACO3JL_14120 [Myxococcota bacterium]
MFQKLNLRSVSLVALVTSACATTSSAPISDGSELNGVWTTACGNKSITTLAYSGLTLKGTYTAYADGACTTPVAVNKWSGHSTIAGAGLAGATKIDVHFDSFTATALTEEQATKWSGFGYCGKSDWAANAETNVIGLACQGFAVPNNGVNLDIYKINGTTLLFGKGSKITAEPREEDRPAELNSSWAFHKSGGAA